MTTHLSWGYDAKSPFNTLSDVIRIDADHGQNVYTAIDIIVPGLTARMNNYYLLLAYGLANKQEAELDLDTYGTSGKTGVFVAVYQAVVIGFFDQINVLVGHSYARRISLDPVKKQIVFNVTDLSTRQTQTITKALVGGTATPFEGLSIGVEWWDSSGRTNEPNAFQPQVDATISSLSVDGKIISPNVPHFGFNIPSLQPFKVVNGSYSIRGSNPLTHHAGSRSFKISRRNARLRS